MSFATKHVSWAIDETGNVYGELTVISPVNKKSAIWWLCRCSCGTERVVQGLRLRGGLTISCGCKSLKRKYSDYVIGKRYGFLTILSVEIVGPRKRNMALCMCVCGEKKKMRTDSIVKGIVVSCGCQQSIKKPIPIGTHGKRSNEEAGLHRVKRHYMAGARNRQHVFALDDETTAMLLKGSCYYCGALPMQKMAIRRKPFNYVYYYNGIDRIDNKMGYEADNCVSCCGRCNMMKSTLGQGDFLEHIAKIYKHNNK